MLLHHIAIICSSESSVDFYKFLGFEETGRIDRGYDQIVWLNGHCTTLEIFVDSTHPERGTGPEANGLRHIASEVEHLEEKRKQLEKYKPEEIKGGRFFVKDPDGQPIEFREYIPTPPSCGFSFEG